MQAWQKYYSPKICPDYWHVLNHLGTAGRIFLAEEIKEEITRTDDDLSEWLNQARFPYGKQTGALLAAGARYSPPTTTISNSLQKRRAAHLAIRG